MKILEFLLIMNLSYAELAEFSILNKKGLRLSFIF